MTLFFFTHTKSGKVLGRCNHEEPKNKVDFECDHVMRLCDDCYVYTGILDFMPINLANLNNYVTPKDF